MSENNPKTSTIPVLNIDRDDPRSWLAIAAERLSQVRYVFIVQIEDGIPSALQRAALEYSDAVLMGWPQITDSGLRSLDEQQVTEVRAAAKCVEKHIGNLRRAERDDDSETMADCLIRVSENVAQIRKNFQPDFLLPTFAEIRRVVEEEWSQDMAEIDTPDFEEGHLSVDPAARDQAGGPEAQERADE